MSGRGGALILASALLTAAANLQMRAGVRGAGGLTLQFHTLAAQFGALARQPLFISGVLLYGLAAVLWFAVIGIEDLSTSYPVLVSAVFILVTGGAAFFFQERITAQKIAGILIILAGIAVVARA
jgi:drug/metabolite transporter (DMT)-like permease